LRRYISRSALLTWPKPIGAAPAPPKGDGFVGADGFIAVERGNPGQSGFGSFGFGSGFWFFDFSF